MRDIFQDRGPSVEFYDRMYPQKLKGSPVAGDVAFYLKQAGRVKGRILELGVGTGRVALPLANAGFDVTGLDISAAMLRIARRKAAAFPPRGRLRLVRGNMSGFSLGRGFGLVIIPFRAFQHLLKPEDQRRCLRCVRRHLAPGGRFIVDIFDPLLSACAPERSRAVKGSFALPEVGDGRKITVAPVSRRNDPMRQVLSEEWVFSVRTTHGRILRRSRNLIRLRWTYRWEMRYLLELSGLKITACYGDFRGGRPRYGAEQIWVATR